MPRVRLDQLLVERGLAPSRERARALILAGQVTVDGQPATKAGTPVDDRAAVALARSRPSVRRPRRPEARARARHLPDRRQRPRSCLDIGASTGGFTDVLLQRGAAARRRARRRPRAARLDAAQRPARRRHRALQRPAPDAGRICRARSISSSSTCRSSRCARFFRRCRRSCGRRRRRRAGEAAVRGRTRRGAQGHHPRPGRPRARARRGRRRGR